MTIANPKILIVEDDSFMLSLLTSLFQSNGYDVAGVDKHSEALATAKSFNPDVILLDIHLACITSSLQTLPCHDQI